MADITDEQIIEAMRDEMTLYEEGATVTDRAQLIRAVRRVLAIRPSGRKEQCCILKVAATRDGMTCSRGVLGCVAVHDEEMPAASAAQGQPTIAEVLDWAASMATHEDPRTSDWYYDDPHELAKAIRKGPEDWHLMMSGTTEQTGKALLALSHQMDDEAQGITEHRVYDFATAIRVMLGLDGADAALAASPPPPTQEPVDRDAALEEAAKACKSLSDRRGFTKDQRQMADKCAAVILAMKDGTGENHGT